MHCKSRFWQIFLIFINGYISLSLELVVLRQLGFFVGSSAVITSIIMGIFLGFMSLGYVAGNWHRVRDNNINRILGISFLVIAALACASGTFALISRYFGWMYMHGIQVGFIQTFLYSIILLSVGPFLFGFNTTLLSRRLCSDGKNVTGNIMAWDTIGSVVASMATTLILMPFIGVNHTIMFIVVLAGIAALISFPHWAVLLGIILIGLPTYWLNCDRYQLAHHGILVNNANSTIHVSELQGGARVLNMNGLPMSIYNPRTNQMAEYINYINNNFIYNMPPTRRHKILVLGAGGFTAGLNDDFNDYTFVDIEHTLKDVSEKYFLGRKLTPNKKFIVQDASQFLKNTDTEYDLILLDVYSNSYQVPESLITAEFLSRIRARVAPNGVVLMNVITAPDFSDAYTRVFDNTFHTVFTHNTSRQVIGAMNPWIHKDGPSNIIYIYFNRENDGRIYTINKTPVIYDRY
ncbi:MAG: fused MFS/spermidine synthase [Muribaculaceae bacterium]|nr:fused MFS/spermidine synthase [Muribaculaceae bacterium]